MVNESNQKRTQREEEEEDKYWNQLGCLDMESDRANKVAHDDGTPRYYNFPSLNRPLSYISNCTCSLLDTVFHPGSIWQYG